MIITCYRYVSGFVNVPDTITLSLIGSEVPPDEIHAELPGGYTLGETADGAAAVFDGHGQHCELCPTRRGNGILAVSAKRIRALRVVTDTDTAPLSLRDARLAAGLTQQQLADATDINIRQIQKLEAGEIYAGNMTASNLLAIADVLGVDIRDLID